MLLSRQATVAFEMPRILVMMDGAEGYEAFQRSTLNNSSEESSHGEQA